MFLHLHKRRRRLANTRNGLRILLFLMDTQIPNSIHFMLKRTHHKVRLSKHTVSTRKRWNLTILRNVRRAHFSLLLMNFFFGVKSQGNRLKFMKHIVSKYQRSFLVGFPSSWRTQNTTRNSIEHSLKALKMNSNESALGPIGNVLIDSDSDARQLRRWYLERLTSLLSILAELLRSLWFISESHCASFKKL